jgi:hypothetical protein
MKRIAWIVMGASAAFAQTPPSVDEIMARVAANQTKQVEAREKFVYKQEILAALRHSNGKVACEEKREYTVTPAAKGVTRTVVKKASVGRCDEDGKNVAATADGSAAGAMVTSACWEPAGIPCDLFPLSTKEQRHYDYRFAGEETYRGRPAYRIAFEPKSPKEPVDEGIWKGEALIDAQDFEPVSIHTTLAPKVPLMVRAFLGTNVRGLGFSMTYERVADGVWFPATFGGEFSLNVLFFYRRSISINVKNSEFKQTDVHSKLEFNGLQ